jgi:hypothetical protein
VLLPLLYLLANSVDLCELRYICLQELNLAIFIQSLALLDDSVCGGLAPPHQVDARGDSILDEGLERIFSNAACAANCNALAMAQLIARGKGLAKQSYKTRTQLAESSIRCVDNVKSDHDGCDVRR